MKKRDNPRYFAESLQKSVGICGMALFFHQGMTAVNEERREAEKFLAFAIEI